MIRRPTLLVLAGMLAMGGAVGADPDQATKPTAVGGILDATNADSVLIWTDGEETPREYLYADSFDRKSVRGIFSFSRIRFTYIQDGQARKLLTMRKDRPAAKGVATGRVVFANEFWVVVKPAHGPADGYCLTGKPGKERDVLLTLKKGDTVAVKFWTDFERHRIAALRVLPPPPPTPASQPDTLVKLTPASQPALDDALRAEAKLKLAELYLQNGMKSEAQECLQAIIRDFPNTDADKSARAKLITLDVKR